MLSCKRSPVQVDAFKRAYDSLQAFNGAIPKVRFDVDALRVVKAMAALRRKDWRSTDAWNRAADETGLLGELAVQKFFKTPAADVLAGFEAGLAGDAGHDLIVNSLALDVKATRGRALRYKFSRSNANRDTADAIAFMYVEETGFQVWAWLMGWTLWRDIAPRLREERFYRLARLQLFRRARIIRPMIALKQLQRGGDANNGEI